MPILTSELLWYNAANQSWSTPASNGGRFDDSSQNTSDVKNNIFPDTSAAERAAGATYTRKLFIAVRNSANLTLVDPKISIESGTPGDSHVLLYPGTQTDTEDALSARPYGYATLASNATAAGTSISVTTEVDWSGLAASAQPFQVGDLIRIDARATVLDAGDYEYRTIASVSYSGTALTLGIDALENSYTAADGIHIASVIEPSDIATACSTPSVTTSSTLAFDDVTDPITVPAIGGIYEQWTLTITDGATGAYSVSGDTVGSVGTGATGSDFSPSNPNGGTYMTIPAAAWSGTATTGDTMTFTTTPAATPVWYQKIVPAGASAISDDPVSVCIEGESA